MRQLLDTQFPQRWIGRGGVIGWPPRSPDLSPLDFFYWGNLKSKIYLSTGVNNLEDLRQRIIRASQDISEEQCLNAIHEFYNRLSYCLIENGGIFENKL